MSMYPSSDNSKWNLQALGLHVTTVEDHAHAAGLKLGTKIDSVANPKALTAQGQSQGELSEECA